MLTGCYPEYPAGLKPRHGAQGLCLPGFRLALLALVAILKTTFGPCASAAAGQPVVSPKRHAGAQTRQARVILAIPLCEQVEAKAR
jgi:hypothetical protein